MHKGLRFMIFSRLNMDSSWHVEMDSVPFVLDPWLMGSEVDGFKWLNEQWHVVDPVAPADVPEYAFEVITQSYEDHCHLDTLKMLDSKKPILATKKAYKRLKANFPYRELHLIPHNGTPFLFNGLEFMAFRPKKLVDPIYFALAVTAPNGATLFYAPHGFTLSKSQLGWLGEKQVDVLITTFTDFKLPSVLGGHVNPGIENAMLLHEQLHPRYVINSHDEPKKMQGLVARSAKVTYPDYSQLSADSRLNFIPIHNYEPVVIND